MSIVDKSVARWTPLIEVELGIAKCPLPTELILAVIDVESRGKTGLVNPKSGASGLMQVMPGTLEEYNRHNAAVSLAELRGKAAQKQIRVGLWVLSTYWKGAYKYLSKKTTPVPIDDLAHIADLFYVAGPGATKKRLDKLNPPYWESVQASHPTWNALPHPKNVFRRIPDIKWPVEQISSWIGKALSVLDDPRTGLVLSILSCLAMWYWLRKKPKSA